MILRLVLIALLLLPATSLRGQDEPAADTDPIELAVQRGVEFLMSRQQPSGAIAGGNRYAVAHTALSIMSMLGVGHLPTDPTPQGESLRNAIAFVVREEFQEPNGYFGDADGSRMYGHGIVTLMLSEVLGMTGDDDVDALVRRRLEDGIDLILRSQQVQKYDERFRGGWRYAPGARDADLSITVWQVMALRSAKAAGVEVPDAAIEEAVAYLKRSFKQDPRSPGGVFSYQPGNASAGYSQTAAGLLALQVCGEYDAAEVDAAARWLLARPLNPRERWFFYGTYYYAQGMDQRRGEFAEAAKQRVPEVLLPMQRDDGSWRGTGQAADQIYATNMALLSLSVRYHYLPIYQR